MKVDCIRLKPSSEKKIVSLAVPVLQNNKLTLPCLATGRTLHYNKLYPEKFGLFCQTLFGPKEDFTCACGTMRTECRYDPVPSTAKKANKRKSTKYVDKYENLRDYTCLKCEVQYVDSLIRRHRIGLIRFYCPVPHIWYILGPGCLAAKVTAAEKDKIYKLVYMKEKNGVKRKDKRDYLQLEIMLKTISGVNRTNKIADLRAQYPFITENRPTRLRLGKQLRTLENMAASKTQPSSLVIRSLPILPPGLRPMMHLACNSDANILVSDDLNSLYRRVVYRTTRFLEARKRQSAMRTLLNEYILVAEAVDAVLDNGRSPKPYLGDDDLPLKSLSDHFGGKEGRFRQDLMGKRVNYSGRAVLASGAQYHLTECGLPRNIALIFFTNYILRALILRNKAENLGKAEILLYTRPHLVDQILREIVRDHPVLINRAPTLHAYGMQGFYPTLVGGPSVELPSLTCHGMAADFDGDQVGVHLPIGLEAQSEAFDVLGGERFSKSFRGILEATTPMTQDMIVGSVTLTLDHPETRYNRPPYAHLAPFFSHVEDVIFAVRANQLHPQDVIWFLVDGPVIDQQKDVIVHTYAVGKKTILKFSTNTRIKENLKDRTSIKYVKTTAGRVLLHNIAIPH